MVVTSSPPLRRRKKGCPLFNELQGSSPKLVLQWVDWLGLNSSLHATLCSAWTKGNFSSLTVGFPPRSIPPAGVCSPSLSIQAASFGNNPRKLTPLTPINLKVLQRLVFFLPSCVRQNFWSLFFQILQITWSVFNSVLMSLSNLFPPPDSVRNKGGRVFVHCQAGISRSATICLAYLMRTNRVKLDEAFEFVKQRRSIISPNFSFMGQLLQFESQVLASSTCSTEAGSPAIGNSNTVFNFPVSIPVHHASASQLSFLHSPITTSPSCWGRCGEHRLRLDSNINSQVTLQRALRKTWLESILWWYWYHWIEWGLVFGVSSFDSVICWPNLCTLASSFQREFW